MQASYIFAISVFYVMGQVFQVAKNCSRLIVCPKNTNEHNPDTAFIQSSTSELDLPLNVHGVSTVCVDFHLDQLEAVC